MSAMILASGSPRRFEMLSRLTGDFMVEVPDIDETPVENEEPRELVQRLAREKALAVYKKHAGKFPVLAADTIVVLGGIINKPIDEEEAYGMLSMLSGKKHEVMTGVSLIEANTSVVHGFTEVTEVLFSEMSDREIRAYIKTGEPMDKAGAYGIQGDGGKFIKRIDGCFYNVMGFPLNGIYSLLVKCGII